MARLKLGPIEDEKSVKVTVELPAPVHRDLLAYAKAHAAATGLSQPLPVERLIAPMLERFMASDRGFTRNRRPAG